MSNIEFTTYVAEEKENPYIDTIKALADVNDPTAAIVVTIDAADETKTVNQIQRAGNAFDKTARVRHRDYSAATVDSYDEKNKPVYKGEIKLTFTLTSQHKARRRGPAETSAPAKADKK